MTDMAGTLINNARKTNLRRRVKVINLRVHSVVNVLLQRVLNCVHV